MPMSSPTVSAFSRKFIRTGERLSGLCRAAAVAIDGRGRGATPLSRDSDSPPTVSVVRTPGWYDDPTGRHEWRYWMPGWSDLAADGAVEVPDPLRPTWRR